MVVANCDESKSKAAGNQHFDHAGKMVSVDECPAHNIAACVLIAENPTWGYKVLNKAKQRFQHTNKEKHMEVSSDSIRIVASCFPSPESCQEPQSKLGADELDGDGAAHECSCKNIVEVA